MNTVEKLLNMDAGKLKMPSSTFELYCKKLDDTLEIECKAIDPERFDEIRMNSMDVNSGDVENINIYELKVNTILESCPIFSDMELVKKFSAITPKELVKKLLLSGEIDKLYEEVNKVNGIDAEGDKKRQKERAKDIKN
ncbi:phage tail assembly chaperone [Clostridioides difficile]|uniref:phage tail assembly chaperone n=1 Tax=Clostridioides difficile TaxID=1496 RepID=UPI00038D83DB|nr:phage XkdN-like family protein [Clostridioides difficile]EQL04780.1 phage XkdN-like family protein [Clostridioides difficile CD86]MBN3335220.1 phage portal protein [Clostridioides difficile]MDM9828533.1 phage portal protein [Clostridioides difficile]HBF8131297.1 phage portal protein [Clostridioides difficile]HBG7714620.1 phage portal protein [Clostridioides difficile]